MLAIAEKLVNLSRAVFVLDILEGILCNRTPYKQVVVVPVVMVQPVVKRVRIRSLGSIKFTPFAV